MPKFFSYCYFITRINRNVIISSWHTGKMGPRTQDSMRTQNPIRTQDPTRTQDSMKTNDLMRTQEPMRTQDPKRTQGPRRTQKPIRTMTLWRPRTLGGLRTLWGPRTLWGCRILWWPRKDPGTYKLAKVSWFPHHVFNLAEFTSKGRFIYHCWMQINLGCILFWKGSNIFLSKLFSA